MNLINQVYGSIKWKKTDLFCAAKLGISIEEYRKIREQIEQTKSLLQDEVDNNLIEMCGKRMLGLITDDSVKTQIEEHLGDLTNVLTSKRIEFEENLEQGTGKIKILASNEPKDPDEVEELLKIKNSKKWKLSNYYNKQQPNGLWLITGFVTQRQLNAKDLLEETLKNFDPFSASIDKIETPSPFTNPVQGIISAQDLHFGKEGNESIVDSFKEALKELMYKSYSCHNLDKLTFVLGGDLLNMDTFMGTTTSGTPVSNNSSAQKAYDTAFDTMYWAIQFMSGFTKNLEIIYLPGNHDRLSSYHMAHALSKCFKNDLTITFDVEYAERKVKTYGINFFGYEHGDVKSKNPALLYATEFYQEWGTTTNRVCFTGHWHTKKVTEYVTENEQHGFTVKSLPSLCSTDYWHYHNKFTGSKRQMIIELYDKVKGKVSEFVVNS
jgi:hypothetical protein